MPRRFLTTWSEVLHFTTFRRDACSVSIHLSKTRPAPSCRPSGQTTTSTRKYLHFSHQLAAKFARGTLQAMRENPLEVPNLDTMASKLAAKARSKSGPQRCLRLYVTMTSSAMWLGNWSKAGKSTHVQMTPDTQPIAS
eukprot:20692-Amphidinium_carterae.1